MSDHQDKQVMNSEEELNDQLIVRRQKMQEMKNAKVNPFAAGFEKTH